jgi:hypothetical protein
MNSAKKKSRTDKGGKNMGKMTTHERINKLLIITVIYQNVKDW